MEMCCGTNACFCTWHIYLRHDAFNQDQVEIHHVKFQNKTKKKMYI
jgi:hypothetical protein